MPGTSVVIIVPFTRAFRGQVMDIISTLQTGIQAWYDERSPLVVAMQVEGEDAGDPYHAWVELGDHMLIGFVGGAGLTGVDGMVRFGADGCVDPAGSWGRNSDGARVAELLRQQVTAPVRFTESVQCLAELGVTEHLVFAG